MIVNKPDRILEALSLSDNFYLNLLDCSKDAVLAVGLSRGIYLWRPSGAISRIREEPDISCIQWNPSKPYLLACGNKEGGVEIWDVEQNACLVDYIYH
jgi:cell division cycle protein 20 (cofactor of APC complex)